MFIKLIKEHSAKIQTSLSNIIKVLIIIAIFHATYFHLWQILFADIMLLILMFIPNILKYNYKVHIPTEFEFMLMIFVILTFFLGEIRGFVINLFFGIAAGFVGFTIMLILFSNSKFKTNYLLTLLFAFSFSVTFGVSAELIKYYVKLFLDYSTVNNDHPYTMLNLTMVGLGGLISSIIGYFYMKGYRLNIMKNLVRKFKSSNPNFFIARSDSPEEILELIKKGESEKVEFKSSLRINLKTGAPDKIIENSALKTIVAFLNSEGGILLIGVSDQKEISGIEKDKFESVDRFNIHFSNILKERIGKEFTPYLHSELVLIEGKYILKVVCEKSNKPAFLKFDNNEHFFIRTGAGSSEVNGSKMIEYTNNNFK